MFSKTLMVLPLLLSIGCGEVAREVEQRSDTASENPQLPDVDQWIKDGGGGFEGFGVRDSNAPNMLLHFWNNSNAPPETPSPLNPETAQALRDDTALVIDLHKVSLNEELREQLPRLQRVQWLRLSAGVSGEDVNWIGNLKQLRGLSLSHARLVGADFESLGNAESLMYLTLRYSEFTDSEFKTLPRLEKLQTLMLEGRNINDACLKHLAEVRLPSLRTLSIALSSVTDEGMRQLCEVYDLEVMNLYSSRDISAESITAIAKMNRLRLLGVGGTGIAPQYQHFGRTAAVAELIRRLPKCHVDDGD